MTTKPRPSPSVPAVPAGLHTNPDARAWADYFMACIAVKPSIATDRDTMVGWFANAMMAMYDGKASPPAAGDGFPIGALVQRKGSDYKFPGTVVASFAKLDGQRRYVVEDDRGTLFVQSDKSLEARTTTTKGDAHGR